MVIEFGFIRGIQIHTASYPVIFGFEKSGRIDLRARPATIRRLVEIVLSQAPRLTRGRRINWECRTLISAGSVGRRESRLAGEGEITERRRDEERAVSLGKERY